MLIILAYIAAMIMGITLGLFGGGGSILTVPILVYLFGISPVSATAYSLFVVGIASTVGALGYMKQGFVNFRIGFIFAIPAFLGVFLTRRYVVPQLPETLFSVADYVFSKDLLIMTVFAILMILTSFSMIRKKQAKQKEGNLPSSFRINYPIIALEGLLVGGITGFVGAGGGFLIVPALVFLAKLPMKQAIGTSLMIIAAKSLFGFLGDLHPGQIIDWEFLALFSSLAILGIVLGNILSRYISSYQLKTGFGWFVLVMGSGILLKEIGVQQLVSAEVTLANLNMEFVYATLGGALIGLASLSMMFFSGRIAGISAIFNGLISPKSGDILWRALFISGLVIGGIVIYLISPGAFHYEIQRSLPILALAGILVGVGTKLGSGCTSGHGVCGIGRLSNRSVIATMTFTLSGILTVWIVNSFFGGSL